MFPGFKNCFPVSKNPGFPALAFGIRKSFWNLVQASYFELVWQCLKVAYPTNIMCEPWGPHARIPSQKVGLHVLTWRLREM